MEDVSWFEVEPPLMTERDLKKQELAERYHVECEAYDRTVCDGPIVDGAVMPLNPRELFLVCRNALAVRRRILLEAQTYGIDRPEMARAIGRYRIDPSLLEEKILRFVESKFREPPTGELPLSLRSKPWEL